MKSYFIPRVVLATAAFAVVVPTWAQSLVVSPYTATRGGAEINVELMDVDRLCVDPGKIRWVQMVELSKVAGSFPKKFIDPLEGFAIAGGTGDSLPWYEYTYDSKADWTADALGNKKNGKGTFFVDYPSGWLPHKPISFLATLLVVCEISTPNGADKGKFGYLGGLTWGFDVADDGTTTTKPLSAVAHSAGLVASFNSALGTEYDGKKFSDKWTMDAEDCCAGEITVVPEPASLAALAIGAALGLRRRRRV